MKWRNHRKWAVRAGISDKVARYIDKIIDLDKKGGLPDDYQRSIFRISKRYAESKGGKSAKTALPLVIANEVLTSHDASRRTTTRGGIARDVILEFLSRKGDDYKRAWHLHHHLDYLDEKKHSAQPVDAMMREFEEEYPQIFNDELAEFVVGNGGEIFKDLH